MSDDMMRDIETIKRDVGTVKADVSVLKADVFDLKTDVSVLKADVSVLKTDVSVLITDVSVLKTDVSVLKTDVSVLRVTTTNIAVAQSRLEGRVHGLETHLDEKLSKGFDEILSKFDGFAGEIDSSRRQRKLQDQDSRSIHDQLVDHEVRLHRIEHPEKKS